MVFNKEFEMNINDKTLTIEMEFEGFGRCTHYKEAHTNCASDFASDCEIEFEYELVDDISEIVFDVYTEDGEEYDTSLLGEEEKNRLERYIVGTANEYIKDYDWAID